MVEHKLGCEMDAEAERVDVLSREVLGANYVQLATEKILLDEQFAKNRAEVKAQVKQLGGSDKTVDISGAGVGLVDAFFDGMMSAFGPEHVSLPSISLVDFHIRIKIQGAHGRRTDALAIASLRVKNSEDFEYAFSHGSPSVSQSSVLVVEDAIRFFINSERAYMQLFMAVKDAQKRGRSDLTERYQNQMATLVHATSYRDVVAKLMIG